LLAAAVVAGLAAQRLKVPDVVVFLLVGILSARRRSAW